MNNENQMDLLKAIHFSPICACGDGKPEHGVFCDACWRRLPLEMRYEWNSIVLRCSEEVSVSKRTPDEALAFYHRAVAELGLCLPNLSDGHLTIEVRERVSGLER